MTYNSDSILDSIKKSLGIEPDYEVFDPEIIMFINSALSTLRQLGCGPKEGFVINDKTDKWSEYLNNNNTYQFVKDYVYCSVKLAFDPPANSFGIDSIKKRMEELTWRINVEFETSEHSITPE